MRDIKETVYNLNMGIFSRLLTFIAVFSLSAFAWSSVSAQAPGPEYFPQTGHSIQGDFLKFYQAATDPTTLYGYPITEELKAKDGKRVQYFQRARFEYRPELPEGQRVTLTDIGRQLYIPANQLIIYSPFACRLYSETNYAVCFAFLEFFDKNGGVAQFGYPISPFEYHDGVIVQYFEKARMEWQPSKPEGQRVIITDLGRMYFDKQGEDPGMLEPIATDNAPVVTSIQVRAFVWKAVTLANDQQLVFIITQDQRSEIVDGAVCDANIRWPDQKTETETSKTNSNGVAIISLNVVGQPYGNLVYIDITCSYGGQSGTSSTSFRIWY